MLEIRGLSKAFAATRAVTDVNLAVPSGQMVGIIGRSGAGKSTLLRLINRLVEPNSGQVLFNGSNVTGLQGKALRSWRRRCAMIFQQFNLIGRLDVLTNVMTGRLGHMPTWRALPKLWTRNDRLASIAALDQFDMANFAAQRAEQLSGGQQQRVAICRALVQEPDILLADEPIASLDPRNTKIVMDALERINRDLGIAIICNLHSLDAARTYCGRLIGMAQGRIVFDGTSAALSDEVAREIYGIEADEVMDTAGTALPARGPTIGWATVSA